MDKNDRARGDRDGKRLVRLTTVGCALGVVVSWGVLIPLKATGPTPDYLPWLAVIAYPLISFGYLGAVVVLMVRYPRHPIAVTYGVSAVLIALAILVGLLSRLD
jgi:hypothetical protein